MQRFRKKFRPRKKNYLQYHFLVSSHQFMTKIQTLRGPALLCLSLAHLTDKLSCRSGGRSRILCSGGRGGWGNPEISLNKKLSSDFGCSLGLICCWWGILFSYSLLNTYTRYARLGFEEGVPPPLCPCIRLCTHSPCCYTFIFFLSPGHIGLYAYFLWISLLGHGETGPES